MADILSWLRFAACAVFVLAGLAALTAAAIGVNKFNFVLNRMHASGMGDTLGLGCIMAGLIISSDSFATAAKIAMIGLMVWLSSPVSGHLLALVEVKTSKILSYYVKRGKGNNGDT